MTRKSKYMLLGLAAAMVLAGCGKSNDSATDGAAPGETAAEDYSTENAVETEEPLAPITPSDYLIKDTDQYMTLGNYDGLEVTQYTYEITDAMVQDQVTSELNAAGDEVEVERPSASGDTVYTTLTSTVGGDSSTTSEEDTFFTLGEAEYGEEFDQALTGVSVGDKKTFSITFGDEIWIEEWVGNTVEFTADITSITELQVPEYNDEYLKNFTSYTTKEDYEAAIRQSLEDEYTDSSYYDAIDSLFSTAMDETVFTGYPDDLYEECRKESISFYSSFLGVEDATEQEVLDTFGLTEDDIKEETLNTVYRRLLISALSEKYNIEVTEEEYDTFVEENAASYGAESAVAFETDYTRESLVWSMYESKVADKLYESAKITEAPYSEELVAEDETEALDAAETEEADEAAEISTESETTAE